MKEWLVADGLGGYAMGATNGIRTRRYHAYLIVAAPHDEQRFALVNDIELWIDAPGGSISLSSHRYAPNVVYPDGAARIIGFEAEPWPTWRFDIGDGITVVQELFAPRTTGRAAMVLQWRLIGVHTSKAPMQLRARPMMSARDFHALHHENADFRFQPEHVGAESWLWKPYRDVPPILLHANGSY
ncbi:MAG TPA: glycogen debranching enzyme N-terminal domain-containing protein, partial [Gemmatimonadaceae bacterium]|nr:glycogen debranching enzyme N-terminal domain-containing protein [Gemmatimonadaceae bacterium]